MIGRGDGVRCMGGFLFLEAAASAVGGSARPRHAPVLL